MTTNRTDAWHAEAERANRRSTLTIIAGLVAMVLILALYPLLTHDDRACPAGQQPIVGHGKTGRVGLCIPLGEKPPKGYRRYPAQRVPVLTADLYRPTMQDYAKYGDAGQKHMARKHIRHVQMKAHAQQLAGN